MIHLPAYLQQTNHGGSGNPTESSSFPGAAGEKLALQYVTSAAIDKTLAIGPTNAAIRGITVDENHQVLRLALVLYANSIEFQWKVYSQCLVYLKLKTKGLSFLYRGSVAAQR